MNSASRISPGEDEASLQVLWQDGERIFCRIIREGVDGDRYAFMPARNVREHPAPDIIRRLEHEYELRDYLERDWAIRPLELIRDHGRTMLVVDFQGGERLDKLIGSPTEIGRFLRMAIALSTAIGRLHARGLVHKDIKPTNILVDEVVDRVWLTGFGIASRLPREHQPPSPPEFIAGTLPYMAPEQTGRMNRSIDSRSDLYSMGVTLYQMLTGSLPFEASDPLEWVHSHIAKKPIPPAARLEQIPEAISSIIMRLLSKTLEERYQTAFGVESDLRKCLEAWTADGRIDAFALGENDVPDRLMISEKLYGREAEIELLLAAFGRVAAGGATELVVVSGYAGIGKSSLVSELHKVMVPPRGLFASGKFDQYKRDIPYATLAQAFQSLIRSLLGKPEEELSRWRNDLRKALEPNGQLITELVPELEHIIGEQPAVSELSPAEAQGRFKLVLRRFISVFARPEHPLVLFLDDLQWLDTATLELLEDLLNQADLHHLLLIGAYRDNEVEASHPLTRRLNSIKAACITSVSEIMLNALNAEQVSQLVADALHCETNHVANLARLILQKTDGNPFFINQFLSALADEGLIAFDSAHSRWSWDLQRIYAKGYTDNVADLMIGKIIRLSAASQLALQQLACLGNIASTEILTIVHDTTEQELDADLVDARRQGLVDVLENSYRFVHDRVHEAAYALVPTEQRAAAHLRIGRMLVAHTPPDKVDEAIFEIVNQLNLGAALITSCAERVQLAELNLRAGRSARQSTAYNSALRYLRVGRAALTDASWDSNYELVFSIECLMAESELLTADMSAAENRLTMLAQRARNHHDMAVVMRLQLTLYTTLDQSERCVDVFLEYLGRNGTVWPHHPTDDDVKREYERIWSLLDNRKIEELVDLPLMTAADVLDALDVFTEIVHPAFFYDENLSSLVVCRMVSLSLEYGNCDASCFGYVWFAMFAGPRFNNYKDGYRFGQLGFNLVETRGLVRYQARTYLTFATLTPWARHAATARGLIRRAFDAANRAGDLTFSAYSWEQLITNCLMVGDALAEVQSEAETGVAFSKKAGFGLVATICGTQLGLIRTLRGLTPKFGCFDDDKFDELRTEAQLAGNPALALAEFFYWTRKGQARFFAEDYETAVAASKRAQGLLWTASSQVTSADFPFYGALAHAASLESAPPDKKQSHLEALKDHLRQLEVWAEHCPQNFENRAALVGAELARIEGRNADAMRLYEEAIRSAREQGFVQNEGVANEVAARFYAARGLKTITDAHLRNARHCYLRWGADGKVQQLDRLYPHLAEAQEQRPAGIIGSPVQHLDVASVVKAMQALSSEIVLPKLIERLMKIAIENAGADRGLLILPSGNEYLIQAEARAIEGRIEVIMRREPMSPTSCPESIVRYVIRTRESVILDDGLKPNPFSGDDYLRDRHSKSIFCLPLTKQRELTGILLLENTLTSHAFTPARIAVLELLTAQAAISLENTRLYNEVKEREARIRRLVEANIMGILMWRIDGGVVDANEAFFQLVNYTRDDFVSGRVRWPDLTPPEWRERSEQAVAELKLTGRFQPFEKEFARKDGSRVPVLIGGASFESNTSEGVTFIVDLSEQKRAEAAMQRAQADLAHVSRVTTLGELTASIAHELNQPLGSVVNNANACLSILSNGTQDLGEIRQALAEIIEGADRASSVISRVRQLSKKVPYERTLVSLREVVTDVLALADREATRRQVTIRTDLDDGLPSIFGDRVQLQQVLLNLVVNGMDAMSNIEPAKRVMRIFGRTETRDERAEVLVGVQDAGKGFQPEEQDRLFEAFYTTKPEGMGMGLAISRTIVEAHGGRLWAEPNRGAGATFLLSLPAANRN